VTAGHRARPRGYPRTVERAEALDTFLAPRGIDIVIELVVGAETVMERLGLRARRHDTEAAVTSRLELYDHNTVPILSWHEARTSLLRVDGDRRADRVAAELRRRVDATMVALPVERDLESTVPLLSNRDPDRGEPPQ
jgi:adenylate kinase family enzyme